MDTEIEHFLVDEAVESHCYSLTQEFLHISTETIENTYYRQKSAPYTVDFAADQMEKMVQYMLMKRGKMEEDNDEWEPDVEAELIAPDSLSKNSIPITWEPTDEESKRGSKKGNKKRRKKNDKRELKSGDSSTSNRRSGRRSGMMSTLGHTRPRQAARRRSGAAPEQSKKKTKKQLLKEEEDEKRRIDQMKRTLRGKDYTYENGEVFIINKLNASYLPSNRINPRINITTKKKRISSSTPSGGGDKNKKKLSGRKKKDAGRKKGGVPSRRSTLRNRNKKNKEKKSKKSKDDKKHFPGPGHMKAKKDRRGRSKLNAAGTAWNDISAQLKKKVPNVSLFQTNPMIGKFRPSQGVTLKQKNKVFRGGDLRVDPTLTVKMKNRQSLLLKQKRQHLEKQKKQREKERIQLQKRKEKEEEKKRRLEEEAELLRLQREEIEHQKRREEELAGLDDEEFGDVQEVTVNPLPPQEMAVRPMNTFKPQQTTSVMENVRKTVRFRDKDIITREKVDLKARRLEEYSQRPRIRAKYKMKRKKQKLRTIVNTEIEL